MPGRHRTTAGAAALLLGAALGAATPAAAQSAGDGYLFGAPAATLSVHAGLARPSAGSDLFDFATEQLTLDRGDFGGPSLGADLAIALRPRLDLVFGAEYAGRSSRSESRHWVGSDDRPIEQTTTFQRVPVTAGLRAYLTPRGRALGRFAWVPAAVTPFVEAGAGGMWYRFLQEGEFVDFETTEVFADRFDSSGWAATLHGGAGVDYSLSPRFALTGRARYTWAETELSRYFEEFDPIDLSALSATVGINVRF